MRMGHSERKPPCNYRIAGYKMQESVRDKDKKINTVLKLSLESHIIKVKEKSCALTNIRIVIKFVYKELFSKLFPSYIRQRLEYTPKEAHRDNRRPKGEQ